MTFSEEIAGDLERMETEIGSGTAPTFTWKGAEVPCVPTSLGRGVDLSIDGNGASIQLRLIVRRAHFLTVDSTLVTVDSELYTVDNDTRRPVAGRKVTFRSTQYRIISAREVAPQSHFELTLADLNSNR